MSWLTCHKDYRRGTAMEGLSEKKRKKLLEKMDEVINGFESDKNLIASGYSKDAETMNWLWRKATGKEFDLRVSTFDMRDARKFDIRRKMFSKDIAKQGTRWFDYFKVPKAIMRRFPQLEKFQNGLSDEASFFRSNQHMYNSMVRNIINNWDGLSKSHGGNKKKLQSLELKLSRELEKPENTQNLGLVNSIEKDINRFRENKDGSAKIFNDFHRLMNGLDVEELAKPALGYSPKDMVKWREIDNDMKEVRTGGARILGRGIQKVMQTAKIYDKQEGSYRDLTSVVERAVEMIRSIEFQKNIDIEGTPKKYKEMDDFEMLANYGFDKAEMAQISQRKYMPLYSLGATRLLRQIQVAIKQGAKDRKLMGKGGLLEEDFKKFKRATDRIESRGAIRSPRYSIDPSYFLKKYMYDVSSFNFTTHLENNFAQQTASLMDMHARAKSKNNTHIMEMAKRMIEQMHEIKSSLTHVDAHTDGVIHDLSRILTSVTYFRLMGGNLRSAVRNATQRGYELVEFGWKGRQQAKKWYRESVDHREMLKRQGSKFGMDWYTSNEGVFGKSANPMGREQQTRGAVVGSNIPQGYMLDSMGELVRSKAGPKQALKTTAEVTGAIAGVAGTAHRVVEDWNRAGTFKIAFGLTHSNLKGMSKGFILDQINLHKQKSQKIKMENLDDAMIKKWKENYAGRIAYNLMTDIHFEYAKWAKAKPLQSGAGQVLGQFYHYRLSMFDLMARWMSDAKVSVKARDFTSDEMFKIYRMGLLYNLIRGLSIVTDHNFVQLAENDVIKEVKNWYTFLSTDRSDPQAMAKMKEATHGQGWLGLSPVNVNYLANVGEVAGFWDLGENSLSKRAETVEGNDQFTKNEKFKMRALSTAVGARWSMYTIPMMGKRKWGDALMLELGLSASPEQKISRSYMDYSLATSLPRDINLGAVGKALNIGNKGRFDVAKAIGKEGKYPPGWRKGRVSQIGGRARGRELQQRRLSASEARKVRGSLDYIRGQATPSQILKGRKYKRKRTLEELKMEPLKLMDALKAGFF